MDNNTLAEVREALEWVRTELRGTQYKERFAQICQALAKLDAMIEAQGWQPIETAPRDVTMDTYGDFVPTHSTSVFRIRYSDDYISSNTPYPLTKTHHDFDGMHGRYTRTHWMPLPKPPSNEEMNDGK